MVGGGLAFPGAANLLQSRLELKPLPIFPRTGNNIEVFANPRVRLKIYNIISYKLLTLVLLLTFLLLANGLKI